MMQARIWASSIPLHNTHPSSPTPYLIQVPRLSYLLLLFPRLTTFFGPCSSFSYQDIPLKNLPVGLLCDLYQPDLPWRLTLGDGPLFDIHDTYINSVKEASRHPASPRHGVTDCAPGRFCPEWKCKGNHVDVKGELHAVMGFCSR